METLDEKRARLRGELQHAHRAWLRESEGAAGLLAGSATANASDRPSDGQTKWSIYLAAKQRLVAAYAEEASSTGSAFHSNGTARGSI